MPEKPDDESLRLEYRLAQEMHIYYGKSLWQIGSIVLSASLIGFVYVTQQNYSALQFLFLNIIMSSLVIWFIFSTHRHANLAHFYISNCRRIENELKTKMHTLKFNIDNEIFEDEESKKKKEHNIAGSIFKRQRLTGRWINLIIPAMILIGYWGYFCSTYHQDVITFLKV